MDKDLREIGFDELSEILQVYLDKGETYEALEYCKSVVLAGNAYGYMFMGFIYEEGHGYVEVDYEKALCYYEKASFFGCDVQDEMVRIKKILNRIFKKL